MRCFNPYFVKCAPAVLPLPMPCGQCLYCRSQYALTWKVRCELEAKSHSSFAFVTLTYADEHLPMFNSLQPAHLQSFLKRLRKDLDYPIRYFACGEYGTRRGRPHYHLIIFGLKECDYDKVKKHWHFADLRRYMRGVDIQRGNYESLGYVAGYVAKKQSPKVYYSELREPPFHRCSLGLGLKEWFRITLLQGAFSPYYLDEKKKYRYVGRYLRNKVATFLNILEQVKENGILQLEILMNQVYERVNPRHSEAMKLYYPLIRKPNLNQIFLAYWKFCFEGSFAEFKAKNLLLKERLDL